MGWKRPIKEQQCCFHIGEAFYDVLCAGLSERPDVRLGANPDER